MNNYEFNTVEVYNKLVPCLNSKIKELNKFGINNITKEDIWNYLIRNVWKDSIPYLSDMVNDILKLDGSTIVKYVENEIKNRKVEREGSELL